jgi:hypothetical protein
MIVGIWFQVLFHSPHWGSFHLSLTISQVFLELKRSARLKDFKTILKYLMTTSLEYDETKRYSNFFKNLIPILEQRLKTL